MKQTYKTTGNSTEEINTSTCNFTPTNYSIGIEDLKTLPCGEKQLQPIMKTRKELGAVQSLLKCGFRAIKDQKARALTGEKVSEVLRSYPAFFRQQTPSMEG